MPGYKDWENRQREKEIYKEAMKEWLDEKFATFGKWTARTVAAAAFFALIYFVLWTNGWHKGGF